MANDGKIIIQVQTNAKEAAKGFNALDKSLKQTETQVNKTAAAGRGLSTAFKFITAGAIIAGLKKSVSLWDKQAQAVAQVEAGLKATGNAAGRTLEQLTKQAQELQRKTIFGDEEILAGATAQLLTFTNIAQTQFDRTQKAVLDVSTRLAATSGGTADLTSTAIQLGKALNDPVANLGALGRSGIQFSDSQKELIKDLSETGRLAEAQNVILTELEKQYGGSAEAAAKAGAGGIKQFGNALGDILEGPGGELGTYLSDLGREFSNNERLAAQFRVGLTKIVQALIVFIETIDVGISAIRNLGSILTSVFKGGFKEAVKGFKDEFISDLGDVKEGLGTLFSDEKTFKKSGKDAAKNFKAGVNEEEEGGIFSELKDQGEEVAEKIGDGLSKAFKDGKANAKDFQNVFSDILSDISQKILKSQITQFIGSSFGLTTPTPQAKGGAWDNGVQYFAKGGIVNSPTAFGTSTGMGVMGEAGAEAILPLQRGADGDLGVKAQPSVVNIFNQTDASVEVIDRPDNQQDIFIRRVNSVLSSPRSNGAFESAQSRTGEIGVQAV